MQAIISERAIRPTPVTVYLIKPWNHGAPADYIQFSCGHAVVRPPVPTLQVGDADVCQRHYEWVEVQS